MAKIPFDGSCEAEYADGYVHSETELDDISPYEPETRNIFNDILEKRPEAEHGSMVRFSVFYKDRRYDVNWLDLPENARPIRYKHFERRSIGAVWIEEPQLVKLDFGYQYNDNQGNNKQEIKELE